MYTLKNDKLVFTCDSYGDSYEVCIGGKTFVSDKNVKAYYTDKKGNKYLLSELNCVSGEINEPNVTGIKFDYEKFSLKVWIDADSEQVNFEVSPNEKCDDVSEVFWPTSVYREFSESGYAVLPIMQGMLLEDTEEDTYNVIDGAYSCRDFTLPWWGQISDAGSYMALVETPYDSRYLYTHKKGESTSVQIVWATSLGKLSYTRKITYRFYTEKCNYVDFCKNYRKLLEERNKIVTLKDKIEKNPVVGKMIGRSVIHTPSISYTIDPTSSYYHSDDLSKNTFIYGFEKMAESLKKCRERGIEHAYVHVDGWGLGGYDNLHPRVLPPNPLGGGEAGMKKLLDQCREQDYLMAIHDNYRDLYLKSPDYDENKSIMHEDGSVTSAEDYIWFGGPETQMCATQAKAFIERNYAGLTEMGLKPDGVYIDVFSAAIFDECFNPEHPMTREQCVEIRKECLNYIRNNGMIISSEELVGEFADTLDLVHHSPYIYTFARALGREPFGVHVPLTNLIYHDCVIIPWAMSRKAWGLPVGESGFLNSLLNGGVAFMGINPDDNAIKDSKITEKLHREVALAEMVSHEFVGCKSKQKTKFSTGTEVVVDFNENTYSIKWANGSVTEGIAE